MSSLGPRQYKEAERQSWDSVANNWQKWWKTIERCAEKFSRRLIELAEIKPGSIVLDIATGIGEPAVTAANLVGKNGHVLATDTSPQMLSVAKQRAISLNLQNLIEFKEGDIETIDFPSSTFNAVLCRFGLMFLPDLKTGLSNVYRSLVEGGHFAAAVWSSPAQDTLIATTMSESDAFYDAEMISELMNTMLQHTNDNAINRVNAVKVRNVMNQSKAVGVSIPWFYLFAFHERILQSF